MENESFLFCLNFAYFHIKQYAIAILLEHVFWHHYLIAKTSITQLIVNTSAVEHTFNLYVNHL